MGRFKDIMIFLVSMLFPNRCIFCNEPIDPFDDYCDNCAVNVPFIKGEICTRCGAAVADCVFYNGVKINIFKEELLTRYLLATPRPQILAYDFKRFCL